MAVCFHQSLSVWNSFTRSLAHPRIHSTAQTVSHFFTRSLSYSPRHQLIDRPRHYSFSHSLTQLIFSLAHSATHPDIHWSIGLNITHFLNRSLSSFSHSLSSFSHSLTLLIFSLTHSFLTRSLSSFFHSLTQLIFSLTHSLIFSLAHSAHFFTHSLIFSLAHLVNFLTHSLIFSLAHLAHFLTRPLSSFSHLLTHPDTHRSSGLIIAHLLFLFLVSCLPTRWRKQTRHYWLTRGWVIVNTDNALLMTDALCRLQFIHHLGRRCRSVQFGVLFIFPLLEFPLRVWLHVLFRSVRVAFQEASNTICCAQVTC